MRTLRFFSCAAVVLYLLTTVAVSAKQQSSSSPPASFDVTHYSVQLQPDIELKSITGKVRIRFVARVARLAQIELNCGDLTIDSVREDGSPQNFDRLQNRVLISLSHPAKTNEAREIEIEYHGAPRRGIRFFPDRQQVYTVFWTSHWMVCVDAPEDRSTLHMQLILPSKLTGVANGRMIAQRPLPNNKISVEWRQDFPIPSYTFGFTAGPFRTISERRGRVELRYLTTQFSENEMRRIFRDTADMIDFYERRSGVRYADSTYTQVLAAGNADQEMSSFTALSESYGREVLANERAVWLGAHELAHQWWGNMVTCRYWTHFWLNEGMATFMASAYKEHRFGRDEYLREIAEYRVNYEKVRSAGKDRSLVFPDWNNPTRDDRTLVYDKGAYVLHLLRVELGERAFWAGIRQYTREYFGKSVTTSDFQRVMEQVSKKNLKDFFARWVYLTQQSQNRASQSTAASTEIISTSKRVPRRVNRARYLPVGSPSGGATNLLRGSSNKSGGCLNSMIACTS
jgi:aminopeptidase N